jgi:hypothetical protein
MDHIERIERQIEELAQAVRRSRRLMLLGQASAVSGVLLLTWWLVHRSVLSLTWFLAGVALSLFGLVMTGSSKRSTDDLQEALRMAEEHRIRAIDALHMHDTGGQQAD